MGRQSALRSRAVSWPRFPSPPPSSRRPGRTPIRPSRASLPKRPGRVSPTAWCVPVFNEEGNVEALAGRVVAAMEAVGAPFELLIVDDGSSDRTPDLLRALAARDARVRVVRFTRNYGQEAAVEALYLNARAGGGSIQMDGDLQHPPEEIPAPSSPRKTRGTTSSTACARSGKTRSSAWPPRARCSGRCAR